MFVLVVIIFWCQCLCLCVLFVSLFDLVYSVLLSSVFMLFCGVCFMLFRCVILFDICFVCLFIPNFVYSIFKCSGLNTFYFIVILHFQFLFVLIFEIILISHLLFVSSICHYSFPHYLFFNVSLFLL